MSSVFLLHVMPDWERLKPAPQNEPYRQWFYSHWGRENAVISGTGRNVEYTPFRQRLSIKVARGGRERYFIDGRSIAVDDDNYLILNDNRTYGSRFESEVEIESFSVFFRPGLAEEVMAHSAPPSSAVSPTARPRPAAGRVRRVAATARFRGHAGAAPREVRDEAGVEDAGWYEEQFQFLLERMLANHRRLTERSSACRHSRRRRSVKSIAVSRSPSTSCIRTTNATSAWRKWPLRPACRNSTS